MVIGSHITYSSVPYRRPHLSTNSSFLAPAVSRGLQFTHNPDHGDVELVIIPVIYRIALLSGSVSRQLYRIAIRHRMRRPVTAAVLRETIKWMPCTLQYLPSIFSSSPLQTAVVLFSFALSSWCRANEMLPCTALHWREKLWPWQGWHVPFSPWYQFGKNLWLLSNNRAVSLLLSLSTCSQFFLAFVL